MTVDGPTAEQEHLGPRRTFRVTRVDVSVPRVEMHEPDPNVTAFAGSSVCVAKVDPKAQAGQVLEGP